MLTANRRSFQVSGKMAYDVDDGEAFEITKPLHGLKRLSDDKDDDWLSQEIITHS